MGIPKIILSIWVPQHPPIASRNVQLVFFNPNIPQIFQKSPILFGSRESKSISLLFRWEHSLPHLILIAFDLILNQNNFLSSSANNSWCMIKMCVNVCFNMMTRIHENSSSSRSCKESDVEKKIRYVLPILFSDRPNNVALFFMFHSML